MDNKTKVPKIGLVGRCDSGGLGIMTLDFYNNLPIHKTMLILSQYENFPSNFKDAYVCERGAPTLEEIDGFLEDLDMVLAIETPYNWSIFSKAKEKGIKTVLIPMYEWTRDELPELPDLLICPSEYDLEMLENIPVDKVWIQTPVDRKKFPFKVRGGNKEFIFNNGHGGHMGRNSLSEYLYAITMSDADVKFTIRSQVPFEVTPDTRIDATVGEVKHEDLWKAGDIYVHLHKFDGLSLPLQEAMSTGYPVIAINRPPYNKYLDPRLLIEPDAEGKMMMNREIDVSLISAQAIAEKIDEVSKMDEKTLQEISVKMGEQARKWSWDVLKDKYIKTFTKLCQKKKTPAKA